MSTLVVELTQRADDYSLDQISRNLFEELILTNTISLLFARVYIIGLKPRDFIFSC